MNNTTQALVDKWSIDLKEYEPYFDRATMKQLLDDYMASHGISSLQGLAKELGVSRSTLSHFRSTTSLLYTENAISYMDKMGLDPRKYLVKKTSDSKPKDILGKWGIDLEAYEKQVDREVILDLIYKHAKDKGLMNLIDLARDLGVAKSALKEFTENSSPVRSIVAITYLDRIGVDPKSYLTPLIEERTPEALRKRFLRAFKSDEERDLMVEHADEIRLLLAKYKNA